MVTTDTFTWNKEIADYLYKYHQITAPKTRHNTARDFSSTLDDDSER